jgi:hypothetical protein
MKAVYSARYIIIVKVIPVILNNCKGNHVRIYQKSKANIINMKP